MESEKKQLEQRERELIEMIRESKNPGLVMSLAVLEITSRLNNDRQERGGARNEQRENYPE